MITDIMFLDSSHVSEPSILEVKKLTDQARLPEKAYSYDGGWDLFCGEGSVIKVGPYDQALIGTGIAMKIPYGYVGVIKDRSGFSKGTRMVIAAGVIDAQYRGEVKILFENHSPDEVVINPGDKIAQMLLIHVPRFEVREVNELDATDRGEGGFGSTGT